MLQARERTRLNLSHSFQDGKPYILSLEAGASMEDPRNQGYTLAVTSKYASKEDMDYYDNECEAHKHLKSYAKPMVQGVMTVFFEDAINSSGH